MDKLTHVLLRPSWSRFLHWVHRSCACALSANRRLRGGFWFTGRITGDDTGMADTRNCQAENDVDLREFITDLRILKLDVNHFNMEQLKAENLYADIITKKAINYKKNGQD